MDSREPTYEVTCGGYDEEGGTLGCCTATLSALPEFHMDMPSPFEIPRPGIREASMRHDVLARRKYRKPFKQFKFNRARRQRP